MSSFAFPLLNDDLTQLRSILTVLGLRVGCRPEGDLQELALETPLYRPCGRRYGSLGILPPGDISSDGLRMAIQASLSLTARSISERWFRLHHRESWILAAAPTTRSDVVILLALDQQFVLQGMDHHAADYFGCVKSFEKIFYPIQSLARSDVPVQLTDRKNGDSWTGLLTPPYADTRGRWAALGDLVGIRTSKQLALPALTSGRRQKVEAFIEANLETSLSVERLAKEAGMSASHFSRAFRNAFRMTPHRYVMWRRLMRARELIESTDAGFAEIAMAAGFSDQAHLSRLFQTNMGQSPREFRRHCR